MSSGVLSWALRNVGSAPLRNSSFMHSALSCNAHKWRAVLQPEPVVSDGASVALSNACVGIFWTRKSTRCNEFPISRSTAKCRAVSPISYSTNTFYLMWNYKACINNDYKSGFHLMIIL
jgi:hypothetical protein